MKQETPLVGIHDKSTVDRLPAEELEESLRQRKDELREEAKVKFPEWARTVLKLIDAENADEELRRVRKVTKMMRYYRGEQRGFWSAVTGDWVTMNPDDYEGNDAAMLLINNQIRPMAKSLKKEWARSRTRLKGTPQNDTIKNKGAARFSTGVLDLYQPRLMPESFRQIESSSALLAGNYIRYTRWDADANRHTVTFPKSKKVTGKVHDDYWWCPDCNHEGQIKEGQEPPSVCPMCKSPDIEVNIGEQKEYNAYDGVDRANIGDPSTELVDVREIKVHLRARTIRQSPYLRRKRVMMTRVLKEKFQWAIVKPTTISPVSRYIQETELSSGTSGYQSRLPFNYEGYAGGMLGGMTEFVQLWLRPSMYYDLTVEEELKLGSGIILEKGSSLLKLFPRGMYIAFAGSDGDEILDIREEVMDDHFAHGSYDPLIESFWGDGLDDLMQMQELVNEMQSLFVENIVYNASPKIIYNPWLIEASVLSNNPSEMTPMSRIASKEAKPADAVFQMSGMGIVRDVDVANVNAIETMRQQSGAYLSMSGSADDNLDTATAMAIARDSAVSGLGPPLALKAEVDVVWGYQVLKQLQENWVDGVHDKLLGNYSVEEAQYFKNCDIYHDIEITIEPGSWSPRTDLEIRNDFLAYITAGGIPLGFANPQIPYEIKQKAAELFRMPIDMDKLQPDIRNAQSNIEQVRKIVELMMEQGGVDETTENDELVKIIVSDIPIDKYIDDHEVYMNTYTSWFKTDEGKYSPVLVIDSVKYLMQAHQSAHEQLQEESFAAQAKYAVAAQALEGMVNNQIAQGDPANQQQQEPTPAKPLPVGKQNTSNSSNSATPKK